MVFWASADPHPYLTQDVGRHDARNGPADELNGYKLAGACTRNARVKLEHPWLTNTP